MGHRLGSVALGKRPLMTVDEPDGWRTTDRSIRSMLATYLHWSLFGGMVG